MSVKTRAQLLFAVCLIATLLAGYVGFMSTANEIRGLTILAIMFISLSPPTKAPAELPHEERLLISAASTMKWYWIFGVSLLFVRAFCERTSMLFTLSISLGICLMGAAGAAPWKLAHGRYHEFDG